MAPSSGGVLVTARGAWYPPERAEGECFAVIDTLKVWTVAPTSLL